MKNEILNLQELLEQGNIDKAYKIALLAYQKNKEDQNLVKILSFICIQKEKYELAIEVLEDFYEKGNKKKDFDFFANMGFSYKSLEEFENAIVMYNSAQKIDPESPLCYMGPAEIYLKIRNFNKALELINITLEKITNAQKFNDLQYENAIKLKTDINLSLGRDKENGEMMVKLLSEKFRSNFFYLLATINSELLNTDLINKARKGISMAETGFQNKLERFWNIQPLYFGLANYYQGKDQSLSERYYHLGNKEVMQTIRYNSFDYQKHICQIMDIYLKHFKNTKLENQNFGKENIFIVGSPRSGTTLIESIIASNDKIVSGGELLSLFKILGKFIKNVSSNDIGADVNRIQDLYCSRTRFIKGSYERLIDKLPENFLYLGIFLTIFPKAKIIRTLRNPWDVAISLYKQRYVSNIPYSASFFNIGVFMANYEAINLFWNQHLQSSKNILDVKYEDLAKKTVDHEDLYDFLEIDSKYDERIRGRFFSQTASIRQVGNKIHSQSVEKKEFDDKKSEFFDSFKMQREYWTKKGIKYNDNSFFGYATE